MPLVFNEMRVIRYDRATATAEIIWYDSGSPLADQDVLVQNHSLPFELEDPGMTHNELRDYLINEVRQDTPVLPAWLTDEADRSVTAWKLEAKVIT